jgi:hypothetical protein
MHSFFRYLRDHDGVAGSAVARELGVTWHRERRLIELGVLDRPAHRVLRSTTFPETWKQRCRLATMALAMASFPTLLPSGFTISKGAMTTIVFICSAAKARGPVRQETS